MITCEVLPKTIVKVDKLLEGNWNVNFRWLGDLGKRLTTSVQPLLHGYPSSLHTEKSY